jgi:hypothetical protein
MCGMADDDVTVTIRVGGGVMPGGWLDQDMREHDVRVVSRTVGTEDRGWESAVEAAAAITVLVVEGGWPLIKGAIAVWRRRFPDTSAEVEDDQGQPIGYI